MTLDRASGAFNMNPTSPFLMTSKADKLCSPLAAGFVQRGTLGVGFFVPYDIR
jgi:hypothetical protein